MATPYPAHWNAAPSYATCLYHLNGHGPSPPTEPAYCAVKGCKTRPADAFIKWELWIAKASRVA
jgi:hypothetical protein